MTPNRTLALAVLAMAAAPAAARADPSARLLFETRLRYEAVAQDGLAHDADALTLRTRLGVETGAWRGLKALVEGEGVSALVDHYNSTTNGKSAWPIVADPEGAELNRAQISWTGDRGGVTLGRQRIVFGDARFVGDVGFRQNAQTFDALRLDLRPTSTLSAAYAYVDKIHRVFGPQSPQGAWDSRAHLLQIEAKTRLGQLSLYGQALDLKPAPTLSSATFGVRLAGQRPLNPQLAVTYEAAYARQRDYADNPQTFDLDYLGLGAGLKTSDRWASVGLERLDGDGRRGLQTPLATLHAYQGWADVFLTTPADGVRDLNVRIGAQVSIADRPVKIALAAHDFRAARGEARYGREIDAVVSAPIRDKLALEVKAARFEGAGPAFPDRSKLWLSLEYKL